jgi:preprotein translocase subunit SecB|tara:strand:- start:53 stop:478 length:426 start_codon:yes stop_codon:yes gene_type:complete
MNKVNSVETPHLNVLNQYIKDLSYENLQKNGAPNYNIKDNNTAIDIRVTYEPYDEDHFGVIIKITIDCKSKKNEANIFYLELDYFGFFQVENIKSFKKDQLPSEGAKIIFPFARSIIANITQNGGNIPIILDNVNFKLIKS